MITGYELVESQKLYSTGYDDLDNLLEKAFCEGYEYAQYEFSDDDEKKKSKKGKYKNESHRGYGRAILLGGAPSAVGRAVGKRRVEKYLDDGYSLEEAKRMAERDAAITGGSIGLGTGVVRAAMIPDQGPGTGVGKVIGVGLRTGLTAAGGYLGTKRVNQEWKRKGHDDDDD